MKNTKTIRRRIVIYTRIGGRWNLALDTVIARKGGRS